MRTDEEDIRDAALFRFWVRMAGSKPSKVARALAHCATADDHRAALIALAREERINIPGDHDAAD